MRFRSIALGFALLTLAAAAASAQPYYRHHWRPVYRGTLYPYPYYGYYRYPYYGYGYYSRGPGDYAPHNYPGPNPRGGSQ
jgi:hypothetical protein